MRISSIIFTTVLFSLLGFSPVFLQAQNLPKIILNLSSEEATPGSLIEVKILVSSENQINAFDIDLEYSPELFTFERAYTGRSVASLWQSMPFSGGDNGSLSIAGGSKNSWSGANNEIITLVFKARRTGTSSFTVRKADFALADGLGTKVSASGTSRKVIVLDGAYFAGSDIEAPSPQIAGVFIISDPLTKNPVVVLESPDAGSIKWLGIRSRSWIFWSDWQRTQFTAGIPKYAWAAELKALGFNGEEVLTTLYRWNIVIVKIFLILVVFIIIAAFLITRQKSKKKLGYY